MNTIERLDEILADREMTINALCLKAGLTRATFSNAKRRGNQLRLVTIEQVCEALDMPLFEFFMTDKDWSLISEYAVRKTKNEK